MEISGKKLPLHFTAHIVKIRPFRYGNTFNSSSSSKNLQKLKSDRFGMEIILWIFFQELCYLLKSDRFGMEIERT